MTDEAMPAMPALTGDALADSKARHEHHAALAAWFERHPTASPYSARPAAPPAAAQPQAPTPQQKIAALDAKFRAAGLQTAPAAPPPGQVDTAFLERVHAWRREQGPELSPEQRQQYETVLQEAYAGRRNHETQAQFRMRVEQQNAQQQPASDEPAPGEDAGDESRYFEAAKIPTEHLSGYSLAAANGYTVDAAEAVSMLKAARAANIDQATVDRFVRAQLAQLV